MLTIKHINELGDQWLVEADDVTLIQPPGSKKSSPEDNVAVLHIRKLDGVYEHLRNGVVYVMNSAGATVAVYHLANAAAFDASDDTAAAAATS